MRGNYENLSIYLAKVLYGCVKMSISLYVCADRPRAHPPLHTRALVCVCVSLGTHVSGIHRSIHGNAYEHGSHLPLHARVRACGPELLRARVCVRACTCASRSAAMCPRCIDLYMVTSMNAAPGLRMRGGACRCLSLACQRARVRGADGMALRFVCASAASLSSQPWTDTHRWIGMYIQYMHTPCRVRRSSYARAAEADMRHARAEARVHTRARSYVCVRAPASAPTRASTSRRRRASRSRRAGVLLCVGLQREHRRVEHRASHEIRLSMRRSRPGAHRGGLRAVGRRRMSSRCARRRRRFLCARARACVRM
jgi:hypothetical protein